MELVSRTFESLKVRNFRLFFFGQGLSLCGTWAQTIALSWLVLQITGSGTQIGFVVAAQFLPVLLFGIYGGVIADRFDKRHVMYFTQSLSGALALVLGLLVVTGHIQLWEVYAVAIGLGVAQLLDSPARQSFIIEMVGPDRVRNAVTLNSMMVNVARIIGPSIAGILIVTVGTGQCFIINAVSYAAVIFALLSMRSSELRPTPRSEKEPGQVMAGLRYVWGSSILRITVLVMFVVGTLAYEFPVIFPLFATQTLHGNAKTYAAMTTAMGIGAIVGGLLTASQAQPTLRYYLNMCLAFGGSLLLLAFMPTIDLSLVVLLIAGALSVSLLSTGLSLVQLRSRPEMRGRALSLWAMAFLGTTPIGGPIIGYIGDHASPRAGIAVGGAAAVVAAITGLLFSSSQAGVDD
ncbi:MAG TPA: MFS transporter [Candidatus Saccharimonadales bacterium]|nr:MFS transporter [Candidatus Saccharimonadales bacterium]